MSGVSLHALNLKAKQDKDAETGGVDEDARRSKKRENTLAHSYPWLAMADNA